ncbi:MAG: hypothetical protein V7K40_28525 [Nostoc sp.]|uniref:hypothetical protein n=1 Tax=Nostoc sp. TaxID=1180 RepID=UPI002FFD1E46
MSPALSGGFPAEGDWLSRWEVPDAHCAASSAFGRVASLNKRSNWRHWALGME